MSKTHYIVFQEGEEDVWHHFAYDVEATSSKAAIRTALSGESEGGRFLAIPQRSYQPRVVKIETEHHLKIN